MFSYLYKSAIQLQFCTALPYVSLEDPDIRQIALTDPRGFLSNYPIEAVLDEIQNTPDLFSYIQRILDENR